MSPLNAVTVTPARLRELEKKERAHDAYLIATRAVRARLAEVESNLERYGEYSHSYVQGYSRAIKDFAEEILIADRRLDPDPLTFQVCGQTMDWGVCRAAAGHYPAPHEFA